MNNIRKTLFKWAEDFEELLKSKEQKILDSIRNHQTDLTKLLIEDYDLEPTEKMLTIAVHYNQLNTVKLLVEKYEITLTKEMLKDALLQNNKELASYIWGK
jgi:hypothetical protein